MNIYDPGDLPRLRGTFRDLDGTLANPTTVTLTVKDPTGTATDYTLANGQVQQQSTGIFYYDLDLTNAAPGVWRWRYAGRGNLQAAEASSFRVRSDPT